MSDATDCTGHRISDHTLRQIFILVVVPICLVVVLTTWWVGGLVSDLKDATSRRWSFEHEMLIWKEFESMNPGLLVPNPYEVLGEGNERESRAREEEKGAQ